MLRWIFLAVPEKFLKRYSLGLILLIYVLPFLFGFYYTKLGIVINIIWYDVIFYVFARIRENMEEE